MRTKITREFYIKKGAMKVAPKDLPVVFYIEDLEHDATARVATCMCFIGKQTKPAWYYNFRSKAEMEKHINKQIESIKANEEYKAKRKAERNKPHSLKGGDILYSSWGYEQTNVDFYKVVGLYGKNTVALVKIAAEHVEGSGEANGMADHVVPVPTCEIGEEFKRKASAHNSLRIDNVCRAYPWDGNPVYRSWYH